MFVANFGAQVTKLEGGVDVRKKNKNQTNDNSLEHDPSEIRYFVRFEIKKIKQALKKFEQKRFKSHGRSLKYWLSLEDLWDIYLK